MKKILFAVLLMMLPLLSISATGRTWFQSTTYDATNVFDLNQVFYTPKLNADWNTVSVENGTYNNSNYLGQFGATGCDHQIKITIETDGRFVSQSDSTKYRDFHVAMIPVPSGGTDYPAGRYNKDLETGMTIPLSERAKNTKDHGSTYFIIPKTNSSEYFTGTIRSVYISHVWVDMMLCLDPLTADDLKHIAEKDDYIATIHYEWECMDSNCSDPNHTGSFDMVIRGYFGSDYVIAQQDLVYMFVIPDVSAENMRLLDYIGTGNSKKVADIQIYTNTRTIYRTSSDLTGGHCAGYAWKDHVFSFISASSDYTTSNAEGFRLKNMRNPSLQIPYTVKVLNSDGTQNTNPSGTPIVYDGTAKYTGNTAAAKREYCINLGDYILSGDKYGNTYHTINYLGSVWIDIPDFADPGTGQNVSTNPNGTYSGVYESTIYYHIIYE